MEIQFDTDAMSNLLCRPAALTALIRAARHGAWSVFISLDVLSELLSSSSQKHLRARAEGLLRLFAELEGQFHTSLGTSEIWPVELDRVVASTPRAPKKRDESVRTVLTDLVRARDPTATGAREVREELMGKKAVWEQQAIQDRRRFRDLFIEKRLKFRSLVSELRAYGPSMVPEGIYTIVLRDIVERPHFPVSKLFRNTRRYRSIRTWAALQHLMMFAETVPPDILNQHPMGRWLRSGRNDVFDAAVAAGAAYSDLLVTEDAILTERCRFLRNRQCIGFRPIGLDELLRLQC
ncbi:hypothetical protein HUA78_01195 [Myxococcus sp. CA033]|uniref:hypothetical protein n=1 Tax=Myxococcus sp. CA033 TaxID=2741516 RepID=UPI00157A6CD9|nr:hypothetical protein [Myxococcus sp. CA033]NTX33043.1 hypothetical protein [Myxococcus sp. CA033]